MRGSNADVQWRVLDVLRVSLRDYKSGPGASVQFRAAGPNGVRHQIGHHVERRSQWRATCWYLWQRQRLKPAAFGGIICAAGRQFVLDGETTIRTTHRYRPAYCVLDIGLTGTGLAEAPCLNEIRGTVARACRAIWGRQHLRTRMLQSVCQHLQLS
jgi:hypothetical protein